MKRTFRTAPLVYKPGPAPGSLFFTLPRIDRALDRVMDQFGFGSPFEASPSIKEVDERFARFENTLLQLKQGLDDVNRKFDLLLKHFSANCAPNHRDASTPETVATLDGAGTSLAIAPNRILTQNGPTAESGWPCMNCVVA